jgi:hypothetical protein
MDIGFGDRSHPFASGSSAVFSPCERLAVLALSLSNKSTRRLLPSVQIDKRWLGSDWEPEAMSIQASVPISAGIVKRVAAVSPDKIH